MTGMKKPNMYKLTTYIPTDYLEAVKQALFDAGAGQIGNYQYCCWQVLGTRMGSGCTSGHGICGNARFSPRSLLATITFMSAGFVTVFIGRHLLSLI